MIKLIGLLMCIIFSLHCFAEDKAKNSVVFKKEKNIYFQEDDGDRRVNTNFESEQSINCQELSSQIKNLAGKPLRKSAAIERYKLECSN